MDPIRTEFLVYGECECGWSCACPEGSRWPKCPQCGKLVLPFRNLPGPNPDHPQGYGYVAEMYPEVEAVRIANGERDRSGPVGSMRDEDRMFDRAELVAFQSSLPRT